MFTFLFMVFLVLWNNSMLSVCIFLALLSFPWKRKLFSHRKFNPNNFNLTVLKLSMTWLSFKTQFKIEFLGPFNSHNKKTLGLFIWLLVHLLIHWSVGQPVNYSVNLIVVHLWAIRPLIGWFVCQSISWSDHHSVSWSILSAHLLVSQSITWADLLWGGGGGG